MITQEAVNGAPIINVVAGISHRSSGGNTFDALGLQVEKSQM